MSTVEKILSLIFYPILGFIFILLFGKFLYMAFHTTSPFEQLRIKKVVLVDVGKCVERPRDPNYLSATVKINNQQEIIKLPCEQDVPLIDAEVGNTIDIREDPYHFSMFTSHLNIWHISSGAKVYYDYEKAFERYGRPDRHMGNIIIINLVFTLLVMVKIWPSYKSTIMGVLEEKNRSQSDAEEIVFRPDILFNLFLLWIFSMVVIGILYASVVDTRPLLLISVPLTLVTVKLYMLLSRQSKYNIILSSKGIQYEPLKYNKYVNKTFLEWSEIEAVKGVQLKAQKMLLFRLKERKNRSVFNKTVGLSSDFQIPPYSFIDGEELEEKIFEMHNIYQ